jgi:hypothetical protein
MAADNNIAFERLELLDRLANKQEEMRPKQIAVTRVEQAKFTAILELPPDRQVTTHRRYIQRRERSLSDKFQVSVISAQTVPAAATEKNAASSCQHAMLRIIMPSCIGRARQWLHHRLLLPGYFSQHVPLQTLPTSGGAMTC